jgi:hypothetical protein
MPADCVRVDDVLIVRRTDFGWFCEIEGQGVFLGSLQVVTGAMMPEIGERGTVTLTVAAAQDLGLARAA